MTIAKPLSSSLLLALLACLSAYSHADEASTNSSFTEQTQRFEDKPEKTAKKTLLASTEIAWSQGDDKWHVIRHFADTTREYFSASSAVGDDYMSLSILFTPKRNCEDGKPFVGAKLSNGAPFTDRRKGKITTRFDEFQERSFSTDYIFTEGSHTIWIDLPKEFHVGARRFHQLSVRTDDYLKGAPARIIPLSGSIEALQQAQDLCYKTLTQ